VEVATHSNPLDKNIVPKPEQVSPPATAQRDTDADGLSDEDELRYFTNLFLPDSDGDGVSDGQEIKNRTNPLNIFDN
jgi:Bacterial TSP3 repeat